MYQNIPTVTHKAARQTTYIDNTTKGIMKELAQFVDNDAAKVPRVSTAEGKKKGQKVIRLRRHGLQETHSF